MVNQNLDVRNVEDLAFSLNVADSMLKRGYLNSLPSLYPVEKYGHDYSAPRGISRELNEFTRFIKIEKIVFEKNENRRDKLVNLYKNILNLNSNLVVLMIGTKDSVDFFIGNKTKDGNVGDYLKSTRSCFLGNYPGSSIDSVYSDDLIDKIETLCKQRFVSVVSAVPAERGEKNEQGNHFVQGLEKLIDTMRGQSYSMILIADARTKDELDAGKRNLENLYSQMVPFVESTYTYSENESDTVSQTITKGISNAISHSVANSITNTVGVCDSKTVTNTVGVNASTNFGSFLGGNASAGISLFGHLNLGGGLMGGITRGVSFGGSFSHSVGRTHGTNSSTARGETNTNGETHTKSESVATGDSKTDGFGRSLQVKFENHGVKKILERIESQLKRYDECSDLGMWNFAAYFLADSKTTCEMAAASYQSLLCGKNSSLENDYILNFNEEKSIFLKSYLLRFEHPQYAIDEEKTRFVTPGALISSNELTIAAGLPYSSVPGLPVLECASFGREVSTYDTPNTTSSSVHLGKIFHMNHTEEQNVKLSSQSLASHTFITGSTGVGKSNAVYQILSEIRKQGKKFLVIEPAKGEYKHFFGMHDDVTVLGTNPAISKMLRINPFSFPEGIHVLEHLDRLVEIFNVCWPMYAAMPAVLKDAVEKSYVDAGWDLVSSTNSRGGVYPSFADVAQNVKIIIDSSEYDVENKGAYKGSLLTRLKSLSNGLSGLIFLNEEIKNSELFDENVIIDLSRIGSQETKTLLMGILVMKLQEYRLISGSVNSDLKHVTILEEAHNLLKRTSTEQSAESSNLAGKSVEMLTNSIAEMRSYGEGFIVADQAPALLDMAVIRNTNTKIILRLPDLGDRELVGKAANLNDEQIAELAKIPCGVAAVYQNEWVQPVLCKVNYYEAKNVKFNYVPALTDEKKHLSQERMKIAKCLSEGIRMEKEDLLKSLDALGVSHVVRKIAWNYLQFDHSEVKMTQIAPIIAAVFPKSYEQVKYSYSINGENPSQWSIDAIEALNDEVIFDQLDDQLKRDIVQALITQYVYNEMHQNAKLERWTYNHGMNFGR